VLRALFISALAGVIGTMLARPALAECRPSGACVDAEPQWQSPAARRFVAISDAAAEPARALRLGLSVGFRYRPAVLTVPAPNRDGRDVNLIRHATDVALGARLGIGRRLELTVSLPAGLNQRGAGIKGVTHQAAGGIDSPALHDPRLGYGYELPPFSRYLRAKLRFEAKLPLGDRDALAGESSFVASPTLAVSAERGSFFAGAELGARLRRPSELFGLRVGSQAVVSAGLGYLWRGPRLSFAAEAYALPSLIDAGDTRFVPAEWSTSVRWGPRRLPRLQLGLSGGGGLPVSGAVAGTSLAFGVPSFRLATFVALSLGP
jgi:hypothetical protein